MRKLKEIGYTLLIVASMVGALFCIHQTATAHAEDYFVQTKVVWVGTPCIDIVLAYTEIQRTVCGGSYVYSEGNVWAGDNIGFDPIMGNAFSISCDMYINGIYSWSDFALRGDGSDVTCSRSKA